MHRLLTIPGYLLLTAAWIALAPASVLVAACIDLARPGAPIALRCVGSVTAYLGCELVGMTMAGALWIWKLLFPVSEEQWQSIHFRLEAWWGDALFKSIAFCFRLRIEIDGNSDENANLGDGPYVLIPRHTSTADTVLASTLVSRPYDMRLRYVLKKELLFDPCLDVVGNRIPNVFVDRSSKNSLEEIERIQDLARDLGAKDGVLIYPEGTRFTPEKRTRIIEGFREKGDAAMADYTESLVSVLPPRAGGLLGILEVAPDADVVLCAHTGFEGAGSLGEIWRGALLNRVVRVRFERVSRNRIPREKDAQAEWLRDEWRKLDAWITESRDQETR